MKRILICANPDLNLIDGSSIWAQTITLALATTGKAMVDYLAKSTPERDELFGPLELNSNINIIDGSTKELWGGRDFIRIGNEQLFQLAEILDGQKHYDIIVVRGYEIAQAFAECPALLSKCWMYLTDIPQQIELTSSLDRERLGKIAMVARRVLCQSQAFMDLWRQIIPEICFSKLSLYSPVIPDISDDVPPIEERPLRAIYAGKFKGDWKTLEMAEHWPSIRREVPGAKLIMIGDKIHAEKTPVDYKNRMRRALENTEGIDWLGALPRDRVMKELVQARVGLSWRANSMNDTLEYSTKILEYGSAGCAAIINRNPLHDSLLGIDYPLFANSDREFVQQLVRALKEPHITQIAAGRLKVLAEDHSFSNRVVELAGWILEDTDMKKTILVAGHDLKFFSLLHRKLEETGQYSFLVDKWQGHNKHDEKQSRKLLKMADVIFCEWCLGNIKWYSMNKLPHQRLVARFHLQEKNLPYLGEAKLSAIDHISYVSEQTKREANGVVKVDEAKSSVIANLLDESRFTARKKMGDARFTLGIIGISPKRKRVDLALDTLELLLEKDSRYVLRIKGKHPFDYPWLKNRPEELEYYMEIMKRINSCDTLRYKVIFDPPGEDVDQWLTMVGFILSPSDFESFHMAVGEGMLTGAVPVVWGWGGADEIWPEDSIVNTPEEAAEKISSLSENGWFAMASGAREYVVDRYGVGGVVENWQEILE